MIAVQTGQLVDGTGAAPVPGAVLHIGDDGTIQDITSRDSVDDGATVVDLTQYQVLPGLIDCHDHLGIDLGDEWAQAQESDAWNAVKGVYNAGRMVRGGTTTVRDVGEQHNVDVPLRRSLNQGLFPSPRVVSCGQFITRRGGHGWYSGCQVDGPEDMRRAVREQLRQGAQFIKAMVTGGVSTAGSDPLTQELSTEEIAVLVEEAHRAHRKVAVHLHGGPGARIAIQAGIDSLEHGVYLTADELQMMADRGTFLVVTWGVMELGSAATDLPDYFKEKVSRTLDSYRTVLGEACRRGVKVAVGGDGVHGRPALELQALIQAGFSPMEALKTATSNGAELLDLGDRIGTLEVGKQADLVAIEGDYLSDVMDLENIRHVMRGGIEQYPNFQWPTHSI